MKTKRKLLSLLAALAIPLLLCGCVNVRAAEKKLAKALEEKYGEEFVVVDSIVTGGHPIYAGPLRAVCYPKSNKNLLFKADYSISNQCLYEDEYIEAIVREEAYAEMEETLSRYYTDFFLDVNVLQPSIDYGEREKYPRFTNASDVSITSFEKKYGEKMFLSFNMVFNMEEIESYDEVSKIFEHYSEKFTNGRVNFFCYYSSSYVISECKKIKNEKKYKCKSFNLSTEMNTRKQYPKYRYGFWDGKFSLQEIQDIHGIKEYDENGNEIIESEE